MRELNEGTLVYIYDILGVRCGMREKLESDWTSFYGCPTRTMFEIGDGEQVYE